jgi:polysaccharide pyruvyl transferase CsaB
MPNRPLLCGYYGEHNLGDDALLTALLAQLPAGCDPLVTAFDREEVERCFGVRTVDRRRLASVLQALGGCDALVLGGGSLLQDVTSFGSLIYYTGLILRARLAGLPVLLWGQGLGPLRRRRSRLLVQRLLPLVQGITWRDAGSAALAAEWGVQAPVGSDPVWSLPAQCWQGPGGPIVLCWRPTRLLNDSGWAVLLQALDQVARRLDRPVHWLPFHREQDTGLLQELKERSLLPQGLEARSRELQVKTPEEACEQFHGAALVVSMRLHGLILAALAGAPCAALSYDPKVRRAADALACPCIDLEATALAAHQTGPLAQSWLSAAEIPPAGTTIEQLRQQTAVHAALLHQQLG